MSEKTSTNSEGVKEKNTTLSERNDKEIKKYNDKIKSKEELEIEKEQRETTEHLIGETENNDKEIPRSGVELDEKKLEKEWNKRQEENKVIPEQKSEKPGNKTEQMDTWTNLENVRNEYITQYQEFLRGGRLGRLRNALGLTPVGEKKMSLELIELREKYNQAKQIYAHDEWNTSLKDISTGLPEIEKNKTEAEIMNKIYNITVLDEADFLEEAHVDAFSPHQKGLLVDAYQRWTGLSRSQRLIASTVMVAGIAGFASLAIPVTASAAAIGIGGVAGKKLLRGTFGTLMSSLTGKVYDKATRGVKSNIEQRATDTTERARKSFDINNLTTISERYQDAIKQEQRGNRNILFGKIATTGAVGVGSTVGLGILDNLMGGGNSNIPEKQADNLQNHLSEKTKIRMPIKDPDIKTTATSQADAIRPKNADINLDSHSVERGDKLWNILKKEMPEIKELGKSGMKDNVIANLIKVIEKNPQDYGITSGDVASLKIGDQIDMEKIQELLEKNKIGEENLIDHARGLSKEKLDKIESFKPQQDTSTETPSGKPLSSPNTTGQNLPSPKNTEVNFNETLNDIHKAKTNLEEAKNQLQEMQKTATDTLTINPENHETQMNANANVDVQEKIVAEAQTTLDETKNNLSEIQRTFKTMLTEASKNGDKGLEVTARLGLAEIASVNGDKITALELFKTATQNASEITNPVNRINAFMNIATKEVSAGLIDNAKSTFDFAERAIGAIQDKNLIISNSLKIANQEALSGLKIQPETLLKKVNEIITDNKIDTGKYAIQITDIRNIITRN